MRTLAIRPGAIGDLILSLPALECLKGDYLEVWTAGPTAPLVRFADRVRSIHSTGLDLLGIVQPPLDLLQELRGFDRIVSWYGANRPEFVELTRSMGLPFEFLRALPPEGGGLHATDFYLNQVAAWGAAKRPLPNGRGSDRSHDREGAVVIPRIRCPGPRRNFAVIHPFSGGARKNWPLAKFQALAQAIGRTMPVEWCAGPDDPPLDGAVRIIDLYELACWLAQARLYIGNDSGITHLAAAAGAPVLALFGPTDPAVWAPRGPHVRVVRWV
jgi:ADP-heptose:LPS heptosyltransferase